MTTIIKARRGAKAAAVKTDLPGRPPLGERLLKAAEQMAAHAQSIEQIKSKISTDRLLIIDMIVDDLMIDVITVLSEEGLSLVEENGMKDVVLIYESLRSCLRRISGIDHELQKVAESIETDLDLSYFLDDDEEAEE